LAWIEPLVLTGPGVSLLPLSMDHHDELVGAVRDGELWKLWYTSIPSPEEMRAEIARRLELQKHGTMLPFAVQTHTSGTVVGMTTYLSIDAPTSLTGRAAAPSSGSAPGLTPCCAIT
jgi:hypothetical protein